MLNAPEHHSIWLDHVFVFTLAPPGKSHAYAAPNRNSTDPWADLRRSKAFVQHLKRMQRQADEEATERKRAASTL